MAMYIIDKNSLYGEAMFPDMDPYNEAASTDVNKMEELYRSRMYTALSDQGYTWFPETSVDRSGTLMMALRNAIRRISEICSESCLKKSYPLSQRWIRKSLRLHIIRSVKIARARRRIERFCGGLFSAHGDNYEGNCREI